MWFLNIFCSCFCWIWISTISIFRNYCYFCVIFHLICWNSDFPCIGINSNFRIIHSPFAICSFSSNSCFWLIIFSCIAYSNLICFCWILWFTCNITIILRHCYWFSWLRKFRCCFCWIWISTISIFRNYCYFCVIFHLICWNSDFPCIGINSNFRIIHSPFAICSFSSNSCFWLIIFSCIAYSNLICFCWILWFTCNITIILRHCYWFSWFRRFWCYFSYWALKNYIIINSLRNFCSYFFTIRNFKIRNCYNTCWSNWYFIGCLTIDCPVISWFCNCYSFWCSLTCWCISKCDCINILRCSTIRTCWWGNCYTTIFIGYYARRCRCYCKNYWTLDFCRCKCCSSCTIVICYRTWELRCSISSIFPWIV